MTPTVIRSCIIKVRYTFRMNPGGRETGGSQTDRRSQTGGGVRQEEESDRQEESDRRRSQTERRESDRRRSQTDRRRSLTDRRRSQTGGQVDR